MERRKYLIAFDQRPGKFAVSQNSPRKAVGKVWSIMSDIRAREAIWSNDFIHNVEARNWFNGSKSVLDQCESN